MAIVTGSLAAEGVVVVPPSAGVVVPPSAGVVPPSAGIAPPSAGVVVPPSAGVVVPPSAGVVVVPPLASGVVGPPSVPSARRLALEPHPKANASRMHNATLARTGNMRLISGHDCNTNGTRHPPR